MTNPIERAGAEIPVQSWPEWVEEWQALQGASGDLESQKVEDRGAAYQSADVTDAAADPLLRERITARRRPLAMFLPAAGLYGSALVLVVCVAVFAVWQFEKALSPSESSTGPFVQEKLPIADPTETVIDPKDAALKDSSSGAVAVVISDQSTPKNGAAQAKPPSADSASPVPVEVAGAEIQLERSFQSAASVSSNRSAEEPISDRNDRPLPAASGGVDPALSNELSPMRDLAAESAGARPQIVLKGAPTGGASEARSRSMRPANVVSPEPTSRLPVNPPPAAALVPSHPNPEAGGAISKTDSDAAEAAVSRVTISVGDPGGSNRASAESVLETNVRDAPPPTVETAALLSRGDALFETRDIASARLFYEYAANAGDAQAAIRLGETFDPAFLSRAQVKGVRGEPAVALKWYKRAQELGASDAEILVFGLQLK